MNENWRQMAETLLFDYGKSVLGQNAGGMIAKLLKTRGIDGARRAIKMAEGKQNPREYFGAVAKEKPPADVQIGEIVGNLMWDGGKWKDIIAK